MFWSNQRFYVAQEDCKSAYRWAPSSISSVIAGQTGRFLDNTNAKDSDPAKSFTIALVGGEELHLSAATTEQRDQIVRSLNDFVEQGKQNASEMAETTTNDQVMVTSPISSADGCTAPKPRLLNMYPTVTENASGNPPEYSMHAAGGSAVRVSEMSDEGESLFTPDYSNKKVSFASEGSQSESSPGSNSPGAESDRMRRSQLDRQDEPNVYSLVQDEADAAEVQLFVRHVWNANRLRTAVLDLGQHVPPQSPEVLQIVKDMYGVLNDLSILKCNELSTVLVVIKDCVAKLETMFKHNSFNSKIVWKMIKQNCGRLTEAHLAPTITTITFSDGRSVNLEQLFVAEVKQLIELSSAKAARTTMERIQELRADQLTYASKIERTSASIIARQRKLQHRRDERIHLLRQIAAATPPTAEEMAEAKHIFTMREQVRLLNLTIKASYEREEPVYAVGVYLFTRKVCVASPNPDLVAQRALLEQAIAKHEIALLAKRDPVRRDMARVKHIEAEIADHEAAIAILEDKIRIPNQQLSEVEKEIDDLLSQLDEMRKHTKQPIVIMQKISECAFTLQTLLTETKQTAIPALMLVFKEAAVAVRGLMDWCDHWESLSEVERPHLEQQLQQLKNVQVLFSLILLQANQQHSQPQPRVASGVQ